MNQITVMGNLGSDAEERFTSDGQKIVSFSIASNRRGRDGQTETTWFRITIFGNRFDRMQPYLKKGSSLVVYGELRMNEYTDRNGEKRVSLDVIADRIAFSPFGRSSEGQEGGGYQQQQSTPQAQQGYQQTASHQPHQQQQNYSNQGFGDQGQGFGQQQQAQPAAAAQPAAMSFAETGQGDTAGGGITDDPLPF